MKGIKDIEQNIDPVEVAKFDGLAARWWDRAGEFKPLHELNPIRVSYLLQSVDIAGLEVVDVGCGGGILSESLAKNGARVTGLDMADEALSVARLHAISEGLEIDYRHGTAEALAVSQPERFDIVTCLELIEHVPNPGSLVAACAALVKPGGMVFFSTINRNPKAYALAVVAAEYVLGLVPRGTHDYERFIRPSELGKLCRDAGLDVSGITGLRYDAIGGGHALSDNTDVNYMLRAIKPRFDD